MSGTLKGLFNKSWTTKNLSVKVRQHSILSTKNNVLPCTVHVLSKFKVIKILWLKDHFIKVFAWPEVKDISSDYVDRIKFVDDAITRQGTYDQNEMRYEETRKLKADIAISNPTADDEGVWSCQAILNNMEYTAATAEGQVKVEEKPVINGIEIRGPKADYFNEGESVSILCMIKTSSTYTSVKWFRNDVFYSENFTNRLDIQSIQRKHMGVWYCMATNKVGNTTSPKLSIQVNYKPISCTYKTVYYRSVGEFLRFECCYNSFPIIKDVSWSKYEDNEWKPVKSDRYDPPKLSGTNMTSFFIRKSVAESNFGPYRCIAHYNATLEFHDKIQLYRRRDDETNNVSVMNTQADESQSSPQDGSHRDSAHRPYFSMLIVVLAFIF